MKKELSSEQVAPMVYRIRGQRVLLDRDLAELYGVETRALKQAVRRNMDRFPLDFMFILSREEFSNWRSQFVMSNSDSMGLRHPPMAFTEQGVAMLSSILRSPQSAQVNIAIMRTFVRLRSLMDSNRELAEKIHSLEKKYDERFKVVFEAIGKLLKDTARAPNAPKRRAGFHP